MNSSFPNRWSFSYLKFTKYVTNILAEPKYKYGQQEQVTVRNHNRSTALERSVLKYWGLKPVLTGWLQGHWWGFISRNYIVWPTFLLMNVFIALKGSHFWFLFDFTAAGVVPCGGRKTSPRTSTIVQFIFYFGPLRSAWYSGKSEINDWFRLIF